VHPMKQTHMQQGHGNKDTSELETLHSRIASHLVKVEIYDQIPV